MQKDSTLNDHKTRLLIYKQWKSKIHPKQALQNIATLTGKNLAFKEVHFWYSQFNRGNADIFDPTLSLSFFCSYFSGQKSGPSNLLDSLLFLDENEYSRYSAMTIKDGRFLFYFHKDEKQEKSFVTMYDFFRDIKRTHPLLFNINDFNFITTQNYLLCMEKSASLENEDAEFLKLHTHVEDYDNWSVEEFHSFYTFRIDYVNLTIKQMEMIKIDDSFESAQIRLNQLDDQKFQIYDENKAMTGRIQNDGEIVLGDVKEFGGVIRENVRVIPRRFFDENPDRMRCKRFVGNKLQYFKGNRHDLDTKKFCEIDLNTMEKKEMNAPVKLDNEELSVSSHHDDIHCWSKDYFYEFFDTGNKQRRLFCFDPLNLKWTDVHIWTRCPRQILVDENENMTLKVGREFEENSAYYRVGLRKPDRLLNLTILAALKESKLYGNTKYLNVTRQMPF